jgi:hypothetical protein
MMLERARNEEIKASELKQKVEIAKCEAREVKQAFHDHFDGAAAVMRVVASTLSKLAAVENAREKNIRLSEMKVQLFLPRFSVSLDSLLMISRPLLKRGAPALWTAKAEAQGVALALEGMCCHSPHSPFKVARVPIAQSANRRGAAGELASSARAAPGHGTGVHECQC